MIIDSVELVRMLSCDNYKFFFLEPSLGDIIYHSWLVFNERNYTEESKSDLHLVVSFSSQIVRPYENIKRK